MKSEKGKRKKPKQTMTIHARVPTDLIRVVDYHVENFNRTNFGKVMTRTDAFVWLLQLGLLAANAAGQKLREEQDGLTAAPAGDTM